MRIMAIGDSNTYGYIDSRNHESGGYRIKLDQKLAAAGISADFVGSQSNGPSSDNQHEGYPRMTIDWLMRKAHQVIPTYKPDVLLVIAGNNDAVSDSVATMKSDIAKMIDGLSEDAPNARILVATIPPPRPGNPAGQSLEKVVEFNGVLPGIVASKAASGVKVSFVDTKLTVDDMSPIGPDKGVHPSAQGYEKIANSWFDAIMKIAGGDTPAPSEPPPTGGTGHPVVARDDNYALDAGKNLYFATKYLIMNDKGADGGLKITSVAGTSEHGVAITAGPGGSLVYKAPVNWSGIDHIAYTLADADGSTDTGTINVTVKGATATLPPPPPPPPAGDTQPPAGGSGTGHPVVAGDDNYALDAGKSLYFATKYLIMNDKGADGGLKITSVAGTSEHGVAITAGPGGSLVYKAPVNWSGIDHIAYTLADADGSSDTGSVVITVGAGVSTTPPPAAITTPPPSTTRGTGDTGHPVIAGDDTYKVAAGKSHYFAAKYLMMNDKGADGGLKIAVAATTDHGVAITDGPNGSVVYKAPSGFAGTDHLTYTLSDVDGSTDIGHVIFSVTLI